MKLLPVAFASAFMLVAFSSMASTFVGNGGDAVVCRKAGSEIVSAELYDYYEGTVTHDFSPQLDSALVTSDAILNSLLQRIALVAPLRAEKYRQLLAEFKTDVRFIDFADLTPIPDVYPVAVKAGCKLEQLAIQKAPLLPGDHRYFVSNQLWSHLTALDQAGLILHEIIYREAISYGHQNSVYVRAFNFSVAADQLKLLGSQRAIHDYFANLHFAATDFNGFQLILYWCLNEDAPAAYCKNGSSAVLTDFAYDENRVTLAWMYSEAPIVLKASELPLTVEAPVTAHAPILFYPSGYLREISNATYSVGRDGQEMNAVRFYDEPGFKLMCVTSKSDLLSLGPNRTPLSLQTAAYLREDLSVIREWAPQDFPTAPCEQ